MAPRFAATSGQSDWTVFVTTATRPPSFCTPARNVAAPGTAVRSPRFTQAFHAASVWTRPCRWSSTS